MYWTSSYVLSGVDLGRALSDTDQLAQLKLYHVHKESHKYMEYLTLSVAWLEVAM